MPARPEEAAAPSLPTIDSAGATERADAARNRAKILDAARRLFAANGPEDVCMDAIAREAGVGKGTLYRRFGDRAGLAHALLDSHTRELQEQVLRGAPPLGPGAPAAERLVAFLSAKAELLDANLPLLLVSETTVPGGRYRHRVYGSDHHHVRLLLEQIDPRLDAEAAADALLAPLSADLLRYLRIDRELALRRVQAAMTAMVRGLEAGSRR